MYVIPRFDGCYYISSIVYFYSCSSCCCIYTGIVFVFRVVNVCNSVDDIYICACTKALYRLHVFWPQPSDDLSNRLLPYTLWLSW